ncbi:hypothetical protein HPB50_029598 [Hyalomma asiaticum]|nr:hypothetical protein HPB50_029598 [Hyalomma asiaticum]
MEQASPIEHEEGRLIYRTHFGAETREQIIRSIDRTRPLNLQRTMEILKKRRRVIRTQVTRIIYEAGGILAKQAPDIVAVSALIERLLLVQKQLSDVYAANEPHIIDDDADADFEQMMEYDDKIASCLGSMKSFGKSRAWRDVKSETILHCFEKAGFSRGSSTAKEITAEADIDAAAVDGAAAVTSLWQLWEAAGNASLVPSGLDNLDFALADQDLIATEELTTDELSSSVSEKGTAADRSSSDGEGDDIGAPQPGTAGKALAAVDTLRMYLCSEPGSCDLLDAEHSDVKRALAKRVQGTLECYFQKV